MITSKRFRLSQMANKIISNEMKQRIPFYREFRVDNSPDFVSQIDLYGNVDNLFSCGGTRVYNNQNKSRKDSKQDICIECGGYCSKTVNPETGESIPISSAFWYDTGKCWLTPRWGEIDSITIYLPGTNFIGHFHRYFLDIMFSKKSTWKKMTGIYRENNNNNKYILFFNYKDFCNLYLKTVAYVTCGDKYRVIQKANT